MELEDVFGMYLPYFSFLEIHLEMKRRMVDEQNFQLCVWKKPKRNNRRESLCLCVGKHTCHFCFWDTRAWTWDFEHIGWSFCHRGKPLVHRTFFSKENMDEKLSANISRTLNQPRPCAELFTKVTWFFTPDARKTLLFPLFMGGCWSSRDAMQVAQGHTTYRDDPIQHVPFCLPTCLVLDCLWRENVIMLLAKWVAIDYAWEGTFHFWITTGNRKHFLGKTKQTKQKSVSSLSSSGPSGQKEGLHSPPMNLL